MNILTRITLLVIIVSAPLICYGEDKPPAEVMLFGVFHFANPGLDVVKTDQINVMTDENQAYLEELSKRISEFKPTKILLEYRPTSDAKLQERFDNYVGGTYELPSNEVYQLGFRIASQSDASTIHGFDENTIQWNAEPLFAYLENNDAETAARVDEMYASFGAKAEEAHKTLSLRELLMQSNDAGQDKWNRGSYLMTNHVGDADTFEGADATASWWHRNFRMYALIQRYAQPGERVLVIGGQGHVAILRLFLADDDSRESVDVVPYL